MRKIYFDNSKAYYGAPVDRNRPQYRPRITPGNIINGKQYAKAQLYYEDQPLNHFLVVDVKRINGFDYVDYYDGNGKRYSLVKVYNNSFKGWSPVFGGGVGNIILEDI